MGGRGDRMDPRPSLCIYTALPARASAGVTDGRGPSCPVSLSKTNFFTGLQLIHSFVLDSAVQHRDSVIHIQTSTFFFFFKILSLYRSL